jgi:hypothetical protein
MYPDELSFALFYDGKTAAKSFEDAPSVLAMEQQHVKELGHVGDRDQDERQLIRERK